MLTFPQKPLALNLGACPGAWVSVRVKVILAHVCEDPLCPSPVLASHFSMPTLGTAWSSHHYQTHTTGEGQKVQQSKWPAQENS